MTVATRGARRLGSLGGLNRDFLKFCTGVAATLGLSPASASASPKRRPPGAAAGHLAFRAGVHRLHGIAAARPSSDGREPDPRHDLARLPRDALRGAGEQAEAFKDQSIKRNWGKYVLVVDGSIPTKDGGIYCMVGGEPILEIGAGDGGRGRGDHRHRQLCVVGRHTVERTPTRRRRGRCTRSSPARR